jgi:hypothetical protein
MSRKAAHQDVCLPSLKERLDCARDKVGPGVSRESTLHLSGPNGRECGNARRGLQTWSPGNVSRKRRTLCRSRV